MPDLYETEYRRPLAGPLQIRVGLTTRWGDVVKFVVQLEYWVDGEWLEVVRYDHDPDEHDVTEEGVHVDVYRDGEKAATEHLTGPLPPDIALDFAEGHLAEHLQEFVRRFEKWHGIRNNSR